MEEKEVNKMTLEEYQEKYSKTENTKAIKFGLVLFVAGIGIIIFTCLLMVVLRVFEINKYAGYASIAVAVLVFIFLYIVPVIQIHKYRPFITNVDSRNVRQAKNYNKKLRNDISDKMIDFTSKVVGKSWYDEVLIGKLAIARQTSDDKEVKSLLTQIYDTSVRKEANKIISGHAVKVGLLTAASQSAYLDSAFVAVYELNLIKDLVYLYGFRPSNGKLLKIYRNVIINSLLTYGVSNGTTNLISKGLSATFEGLPLLGSLISTAIASASQGIINGVMTGIIGVQTKRYLIKEYHLQDILDEIELDDPEDDEEMIKGISKEIKSQTKENKKKEDK